MPVEDKDKLRVGARPVKRLLGRILVDAGFVTEEALGRALERQGRTGEPIGRILVAMGELEEAVLNATLSIQRDLATLESAIRSAAGSPQRLGELLVLSGRVTPKDVNDALAEQKKTNERLGEILIKHGLFNANEIQAVLAYQECQKDPGHPGRCRLGEVLVATNRITREQLNEALALRAVPGSKKIGEILVETGHVGQSHIDHVLHIQHRLAIAALVAALTLAAMPQGEVEVVAEAAQSQSARVFIGATVKAYAEAKTLRQPGELVITHADAVRGYVDAPLATTLEVNTNNHSGYMISFNGLHGPFREIYVKGLQNETQITSDGGWVVQTGVGVGRQTLQLSYRFILASDASPGTYAWPLVISVSPF